MQPTPSIAHLLHHIVVFVILLLGSTPALSAHATSETISINKKIGLIKTLVDSQKFQEVRHLAHEVIKSSLAANYSRGTAWGRLYNGLANFKLNSIDTALRYAQMAYSDFVVLDDPRAQLESLTLMGEILVFKPDSDSSNVCLEKAVNIAIHKLNDSSLIASPYLWMGVNYSNTGEYDKAMGYLQAALHLFQRSNNKQGEARVLNNIGKLLYVQGDLHNAMEFHFNALNIYERLNYKQGISHQRNNIGMVLIDLNDYENALIQLRLSAAIKIQTNDMRGLSNSLMNIGYIHMMQNNFDSALTYLNQSKKIKTQINDANGLADILLNEGETYQRMGQLEKSAQLLEQARNIFSSNNDIKGLICSYIQLATTHFKLKQHKTAFEHLDEAKRITQHSEMKYLRIKVYKAYSDIYGSLNDCQNSLLYYKKYINLRDSISSLDNIRKTLSIQMLMEYKQILKQHADHNKLALKKAEEKSSANIRIAIFFIVAFLIAVIFIFFIINATINKERFYKRLNAKQEEVKKQRQELIEQRNQLEIQNNIVVYQRDKVITLLTELGESIDYAKKIQQAVLPSHETLTDCFKDHFIINQPKDTVGGDFYWVGKTNTDHYIFVIADSTGHGIPGGFMSMLCMTMVVEIVARNICDTPADALNELRNNIITTLGQQGYDSDNTDGMDIAFCAYHPDTQKLYYSGANIPIIIATETELEASNRIVKCAEGLYEIKPNRMPISYSPQMNPFENVVINISHNDTIYLLSDGYTDQFGGEKGKKFGHTALRSLIASIKNLPLSQQKQVMHTTIEKWKESVGTQTDDILVFSAKIL